jgi:hypothetical protein
VEERRVETDPARLEVLAGTYYDATRAAVRQIPLVDGHLVYMNLRLVPIGPDRFTFVEEPATEVQFDDESVTTSTPGGTYRYEKLPQFDSADVDGEELAGRYESRELGVTWRIDSDERGLVVHRHKHPDTHLTPVMADGFADDWTPVVDYPAEFLLVFDRSPSGEIAGFRVSGQRARGMSFARAR